MTEFFEDSVIRGSATRVQQWGPGNVAPQRGPGTRSMALGDTETVGPNDRRAQRQRGPMTKGPEERGADDAMTGVLEGA